MLHLEVARYSFSKVIMARQFEVCNGRWVDGIGLRRRTCHVARGMKVQAGDG
jgi:hypothetical protein